MKFNINHQIRLISITLILLIFFAEKTFSQVLVSEQSTLMGSIFEITIVDKDSLSARQHIQMVNQEIARIENLISEWRPETQISQVNRQAGIKPVKVDTEVFELTKRAIAYAEMSKGAFDISIIAMDKIWKFDGSMTAMPTAESISKAIQHVGYQHILLDSVNTTIFLTLKGMKIGFGSIGKGYAADRGRALMQQKGIQAGIVNASGDLATWGLQPNKENWKIGIRSPFKSYKMIKVLQLQESAVATSGDYEKYAEINHLRYAHIINPKTGYPATGLTSVTIYGPSAEFANALSTSIMVLGKKEGLKLMKQYPTYRAILISDKGKINKN